MHLHWGRRQLPIGGCYRPTTGPLSRRGVEGDRNRAGSPWNRGPCRKKHLILGRLEDRVGGRLGLLKIFVHLNTPSCPCARVDSAAQHCTQTAERTADEREVQKAKSPPGPKSAFWEAGVYDRKEEWLSPHLLGDIRITRGGKKREFIGRRVGAKQGLRHDHLSMGPRSGHKGVGGDNRIAHQRNLIQENKKRRTKCLRYRAKGERGREGRSATAHNGVKVRGGARPGNAK